MPAAEVDYAAVRARLDAMARDGDSGRAVTALHHRRSDYSSSFPIDELQVTFDDGSRTELMLKNLSRQAMLPTARRTRPHHIDDPQREIQTYRTILPAHAPGTPRYHDSVVDPARDRYWLLIEHVRGLQLCDVGDFSAWEHVAAWLAHLHSIRNGSLNGLAERSRLMRYDSRFLSSWGDRAARFLLEGGARTREVRELMAAHDSAVTLLMGGPLTLIHGELYASNIVIAPNGGSPRVCVVDWELAAVGPPLVDVAALVAGWDQPHRERLVSVYEQARHNGGDGDPTPPRLLHAARLHLAVRLLGWAQRWTPPSRHARDWWHEAKEAAADLEAAT